MEPIDRGQDALDGAEIVGAFAVVVVVVGLLVVLDAVHWQLLAIHENLPALREDHVAEILK